MIALLDHLWQSTLFAAAVGLAALLLRRHAARVRFWLWFAASVKFLLPFSALVALGGMLARLSPAPLPAALPAAPGLLAMRPAAAPFSTPDMLPAALPVEPGINLVLVMLAVWALGFAVLTAVRLLHWSRLRRLLADASDMGLKASVRVVSSDSQQEPGLVGIWKPVIVLPRGLLDRLSASERESILAHELSHHRRRDNLTAALHMAVETLFWFYPPVWLIGARLIAERERACDESVVARGHDPEVYATGILKVCKFCLQSPLACAAGVTGADLAQRVHWIMADRPARDLDRVRQASLGLAGAAVLLLPLMAGFAATPLTVKVTAKVTASVRDTVSAMQTRLEADSVAVQAMMAKALPVGESPLVAEPVEVPTGMPASASMPLPVDAVAASGARLPAVPPLPGTQGKAPAVPAVPGDAQAAPRMAVFAPRPVRAEVPVQTVSLMLLPTGRGDPNAVTCRVPQQLPGSRLAGPEVCRTNRVWAELRASKTVISPDGQSLMASTHVGRGSAPCLVDIRYGGIVPKDCF